MVILQKLVFWSFVEEKDVVERAGLLLEPGLLW